MQPEIWHDKSRNVVIYRAADAIKLAQYAHGGVHVNGEYFAMPATLTNLQVARCFDLPVIRPLVDYDYPHIGQLTPFHAQTETANFLSVTPRAFVLSDMGTGKTLSALWAADALMCDVERQGGKLRALISCPLSTMQTVWADNIFAHFLGRRTAVILHGTPEQRIEALSQPHDFYIINHDGFKTGVRRVRTGRKRQLQLNGFSAALAQRTDIQLFVFDEVGAFRDHTTLRSQAAHALSAKRNIVWAMTGTPTPNGPIDAYGIAHLVNRAKGEAKTSFKNRIMFRQPDSQFKWLYKPGAKEEARKLMMPAIRFKLEDCQDIPALTTISLSVPLTDEQRKKMREIKNQFVLDLKGGKVTAVNEASTRTKLLQIACGAVYDDNHVAHRVSCIPRINALREIIDESLGKVVIFCPFLSAVDMLEEGLTDFTRAVIVGATPPKRRTEIIRWFQNERDPRVLIAHPETIAEGQNLVVASTTVWWGPHDKTAVVMQANGRMHRPGQTRMCAVVNLSGCALERESYARLANNQSQQGLLLQMVEERWDV